MSDVSWEIRVPPASFGEHTEEILQKLGYEKGEIEGLKKEGVI